jgi:hypothetical protein
MFGYVIINKPEMKFREFDVYHTYYCGLCRKLKEKYGIVGQTTLSYDMTFLYMLLTGLYEPETAINSYKCIAHPFEKHPARINEYAEYAADINIVLSYYKCKDDWIDERKYLKLVYSMLLKGKCKKIESSYSEKIKKIDSLLNNLSLAEKAKEYDIDKMAGVFGEIMAEIFAYKQDEWADSMRRIGFYLGKFIYLMDAYEDIEEDLKKENYNPFAKLYQTSEFEGECQKILTMMMAECSREFEHLPVLENIEIMRNILYSGVWCRYEVVRKEKEEKEGKTGAKR